MKSRWHHLNTVSPNDGRIIRFAEYQLLNMLYSHTKLIID